MLQIRHLFINGRLSHERTSGLDPVYPHGSKLLLTLCYDSSHCHGFPFLRNLERSEELPGAPQKWPLKSLISAARGATKLPIVQHAHLGSCIVVCEGQPQTISPRVTRWREQLLLSMPVKKSEEKSVRENAD